MERPSNVKVGPFTYAITYHEDMDPHRHLVGMSHHEDLEIWIKLSHELKMREIMMHELTHCIIHIYGGSPQEEEELSQEKTVLGLGFGWLQVLRDNPSVVQWLVAREE